MDERMDGCEEQAGNGERTHPQVFLPCLLLFAHAVCVSQSAASLMLFTFCLSRSVSPSLQQESFSWSGRLALIPSKSTV